ncbi:hypothetical protein FPV67DRAFT_1480806 [Lyophyllum atratum]|nr:hypothetical protein FPV67DRAFT_1480806 [Lyophyllum atratum]
MSWTPYVHDILNLVYIDNEINAYNGGYNYILTMLFVMTGNFVVACMAPIPGSEDPRRIFVVSTSINRRPTNVLVLAINPRNALDDKYRREEADEHMRATLKERGSNACPRMYGISAFGTRIRVYLYDTRSSQIDPPAVPSTSTAAPLKEWWDLDVLSPAGEQKFREIQADIKAMCASLSD